MAGRRMSPEIAAFLRECGSRRALDFETIASLVAERFPSSRRLMAADIATFLGRAIGGKSSLNRLHKDAELASWLREHKDDGRVEDVRAACIARFGADRVPAKTRVAEFLRSEGRRGRQDRPRILDRDPELAKWLMERVSSTRMLTELREDCLERFGPIRTPTRSALWRLIKAVQPGRRPRPLKAVADEEVATWLRANASRLTLRQLRSAGIAVFGERRVPSVAAIQRYLARLPGPKLTRKKGEIDRDPGVAAWVWERRSGRTLDELTQEAIAAFGVARAPSRSGLHRYLVAVRRGSVTPPVA